MGIVFNVSNELSNTQLGGHGKPEFHLHFSQDQSFIYNNLKMYSVVKLICHFLP